MLQIRQPKVEATPRWWCAEADPRIRGDSSNPGVGCTERRKVPCRELEAGSWIHESTVAASFWKVHKSQTGTPVQARTISHGSIRRSELGYKSWVADRGRFEDVFPWKANQVGQNRSEEQWSILEWNPTRIHKWSEKSTAWMQRCKK